jgi:transketolase
VASQRALESLVETIPELVGGSADLTGSNNTRVDAAAAVGPGEFEARYIHYGVREHGMAAAMNGLALHGGFIPYGGTFLVFSDYARPAIRLSAMMGVRTVYVLTHDSIGLGEDGPTHQPVEHLPALRAIPNLLVMRPADAVETAECWEVALSERHTPSALVLTRQALPAVRLDDTDENLCARGAYELIPAEGEAKVTLLASGSEVSIAVAARNILQSGGAPTRVVSMPCWALFERQSRADRERILGPGTVRIGVEAAINLGWERYLGCNGGFVGMTGFGASGPYKELYKHFGITAEAVAELAKEKLQAAEREAEAD